MSKFKIYLISILIPIVLGGVIGFIISGYMDYDTLNKSVLSPPGIVFPIVWTILYFLMGISYATIIIYSNVDEKTNKIYFSQLIINLLWSIIFFVFKNRFLAFLWIILLLILIIIMIKRFYEKNKFAGIIQIPYLLWTVFATYLNLFIYILNK